jgi:hypothetical protein
MDMPYMVKGLTHQFTKRVRKTGFPLFPALTTLAKSILTIMGYIMKNRQMAIGIETTGAPFTFMDMESSLEANPGAIFPSKIPPRMHNATQTVRYRSKILFISRFSQFPFSHFPFISPP